MTLARRGAWRRARGRIGAMLALAAICGTARPALAQDDARRDLCVALTGLSERAAATGKAQRVSVFNSDGFMVSACGDTRISYAHASYCSRVVGALGVEGFQSYPWRIRDCLRRAGAVPHIVTGSGYTGLVERTQIVELTASLRNGVRVDLTFKPAPSAAGDPFQGYYGEFDLVIWKP
jgi:hypothetical protein